MIVEALERHRDECRVCRGSAVCPVAAALLEKLGERTAPSPPAIEQIDLDAHKTTCLRCRDHALCHEGRAIVKRAGEALLEAGRRPVPA